MVATRQNGTFVVAKSWSAPHSHGGRSYTIAFSLRCHPGAVRSENQDRVWYSHTPLGELFLLADGVGGRAHGAQAAEVVVEEYARCLSNQSPSMDPREALIQATRAVYARLLNFSVQNDTDAAGLASTVVLLLLRDNVAYVGHLGDSRAYLYRDHKLTQLTRDHSLVQEMVAAGILQPPQAQSHPCAHVLTRCLGTEEKELEITARQLESKDALLLCSDGRWAYLPEERIAAVIAKRGLKIDAAADELQSMALAAEVPDNLSIILLTVTEQ